MKVEVFFIVKTYSNGLTQIENGPYYSLIDALDIKKNTFPFFIKDDYRIAKTELEMELI